MVSGDLPIGFSAGRAPLLGRERPVRLIRPGCPAMEQLTRPHVPAFRNPQFRGTTSMVKPTANPESHPRTLGALCAAITDDVVRLYSDQFGKGPTKARTDLHEDVVVCVLENLATVADRTLISQGHADSVREVRGLLREGVQRDLTRIVEHHTGRRVGCFLSDYRPEQDTAALVFLLKSQ